FLPQEPGREHPPWPKNTEPSRALSSQHEFVKSKRVFQPQAFRSQPGFGAGQLTFEPRELPCNLTQEPAVVIVGHGKLFERFQSDTGARNANHAHDHGTRSEVTSHRQGPEICACSRSTVA